MTGCTRTCGAVTFAGVDTILVKPQATGPVWYTQIFRIFERRPVRDLLRGIGFVMSSAPSTAATISFLSGFWVRANRRSRATWARSRASVYRYRPPGGARVRQIGNEEFLKPRARSVFASSKPRRSVRSKASAACWFRAVAALSRRRSISSSCTRWVPACTSRAILRIQMRQIRRSDTRPDFRSPEHAALLFEHRRPLYRQAADLPLRYPQ